MTEESTEKRNAGLEKAREENEARWNGMDRKAAILDIFTRVTARENVGQSIPGMIYVEEVAQLLNSDRREIFRLCDELFAEEKLDLGGAILIPYQRRFRFPKEIQHLFGFMIEEPLGWPNGEAGDVFVYRLENAIHENTRFQHGKDAFEEENYPHLAPRHLAHFGLSWIATAFRKTKEQAEKNALADLPDVAWKQLALDLTNLAKEMMALADSESYRAQVKRIIEEKHPEWVPVLAKHNLL